MPTTTDGSTVIEPNATGGVTAELKQEIQKVVMGIFKDAVPRLIKQSLTEALPSLVEQFGTKPREDAAIKPGDADSGATDPQRLSLRALEKQVNELNQQLKKRDEAIEQKEQQRIDAVMRSQVREGLAGVLGADNPNLGLAMDSLYDARKRFVAGQDGAPLVKFKSEYGSEDEHLSLKDGLKKLAESELKHLMPSRTGSLPNAPGGRRGNPLAPPVSGGSNPFDRVVNDIFASATAATDSTQK